MFSDISLARRLERAEGRACAAFAEAHGRLCPESGSEWAEHAGAYLVFDGADSPVTQTFGLGLFTEVTASALDAIERFFLERGAPVQHEVCPLVGVDALALLCSRGYAPDEISSVLYMPLENVAPAVPDAIQVFEAGAAEIPLWTDISTRGWSAEHPEYEEFLRLSGRVISAREQNVCFIGAIDGAPGAAAALFLGEGVALLAGASTVPELRRRGLQSALLAKRLEYARNSGCDLAMMVALAGSESQRNAERKGFRVAYTRIKWKLGIRGSRDETQTPR